MTHVKRTGPQVDREVLKTRLRSDACGVLDSNDIGREVALYGWVARRREHGEHLAFVDLRDATGVVQCVVDGHVDVRNEWVVKVSGKVRARPEGTVNAELPTGDVEIGDCNVEVLSKAETLPFMLDERNETDENVRLRFRFLDLRRERMAKNLRIRAAMNSAIRRAMEDNGFAEVETPMLMATSPEGSREFLVPSRLQHTSFYALPQSPQLFKQMMMVGGFDRYYQLARCLRDEDLRADRQFEFTQLDLEASFVTQEDVFDFVSHAVACAFEAVTGEALPMPIARMTWIEAMERFGSDKPDTRFGMELVELTEVFANTNANVFKADCVKAVCAPGGAELTRARIDALTEMAKGWGAKGLAWVKVGADNVLEGGVSKLFSDQERQDVIARCGAHAGDIIFFGADDRSKVRDVLGLLRLELGRPPINEGGLNFLWITEFPMFESINEDGMPVPAHHPFTMPHIDDLGLIESDPLKVRSQSYDLTCNGWELGSGSIRIHKSDVQQQLFSALGISPEDAQKKFGFLLDAFRYGAPPHGGFGLGTDRLAALLAGEESIREVIAFPKTQSGADPFTKAPTEIDAKTLRELGIQALPKKG